MASEICFTFHGRRSKMSQKNTPKIERILLRMHPMQRIGISSLLAAIAFLLMRTQIATSLLLIMVCWTVFSASFIFMTWVVLFKRPVSEIKKKAISDDGSVTLVFVMTLLSSFASMFTVLLLMISKHQQQGGQWLYIPICISGMLLSWTMVHTIFTIHYAHRYYGNDAAEMGKQTQGLDFPGTQEPDYLDFAYFSFVIGCTFQVSDVEITSRKIRRIVLLHSLLSFALNTFVVALTINFIASLMN